MQICYNKRVQMQQFIYVRANMRGRVSNIEKYAENTGFMHVFPNKVIRTSCFHHLINFIDLP
jgi:hypothetical protein